MRGVSLLAAMLLAACTPGTPDQEPAASFVNDKPAQPQVPGARPASHEEMFGQWRLTDMPGPPPDYPHDIHIVIGSYAIEAVSQCIPFGKLLPGAVVGPRPAPPGGHPAPVICARMPSPAERRFGRTLAAVDTFEMLPDGRLRLRGDAGDLLFGRNHQPVLNPFQNTPGPGPHLMWGEWRVAALNGKPPSSAMTMLFFKERLELDSGCVNFGRRFEQEGAILRLSPDPNVAAICERMTSRDEQAADRMLSGVIAIIRSTARQRLLSGREGTILLER